VTGNSPLAVQPNYSPVTQYDQKLQTSTLNQTNTIAGFRGSLDNNGTDIANRAGGNNYIGSTTVSSGRLSVGGGTFNNNNDNGSSVNFDANDLTFLQQGGESPQKYRVYNVNTYGRQNAKIAEQQLAAKQRFDDSDTFVGAAGTPYRVYLRPEQLSQLAGEFRVISINRGQAKYVIPPADEAARREREARAEEPKRDVPVAQAPAENKVSGDHGVAPGDSFPKEAVQTASPAPAPAGVDGGKALDDHERTVTGQSAGAPAAPSSARGAATPPAPATIAEGVAQKAPERTFMSRAGEKVQGKNEAPAGGRWIEVIIAMDPPPSASASPAGANSKPGASEVDKTFNQSGK
jgi:hypothetical protein